MQRRAGGNRSAGPGLKRPPDPKKGPCRWKAPRAVTSHLLSRGGGYSGLGGFFTRKSNTDSQESHAFEGGAKAPRIPRRRRGDRGVRGSIAAGAVGRTRPRFRRDAPIRWVTARGKRQRVSGMRSAEAFAGVVKHPVPRSYRAKPKTPHGVHATKVAERAGNARGTGVHQSFRWQKSVERIARLALRRAAKPLWRIRALAGRMLEVPPDRGPERRGGETVRGRALTTKRRRWFGLWVSARRFSIRPKVFSGSCASYLHR